jgi:hypothetical protein
MKKRIIITCFLISVFSLPVMSNKNNEYQITDNYDKLRNNIFSVPAEIHIGNIEENNIYCIILEIGYDDAIATLAAWSDGTVSLFYSNDKSPKSIGRNEKLKNICYRLIEEAENHIRFASKTLDKSLPGKGETKIYFLTVNREYKLGDSVDNLKNNKSKLSKLYFIARELILEIRNNEKSMK